MDQNELADILADARQYIEDHGWTQGTSRNDDGEVCSLGGVMHSQRWVGLDHELLSSHLADLHTVSSALLKAVDVKPSNTPATRVAMWNDSLDYPEGQQAVLDAFAKAEKIARTGFDPDAA